MKSAEHLAEILAEREETGRIPNSKAQEWMNADDPEALGALYHLLFDRRFTARIDPPLTFEDYQSFARAYFGRCLREDPKGAWVDSRYSAGWDLVGWIASLWKNREVHEAALADWKRWLAELYKGGDEDLRTCLVTATLEHLFEQPGLPEFFAEWKEDPLLAEAYGQAMEWVDHGGRSPLGHDGDS